MKMNRQQEGTNTKFSMNEREGKVCRGISSVGEGILSKKAKEYDENSTIFI